MLLAKVGARARSGDCHGALEQGIKVPNAHIGPCDELATRLQGARIGSSTLPVNPQGKTAVKKKADVESIQILLNFSLVLMVKPNGKIKNIIFPPSVILSILFFIYLF